MLLWLLEKHIEGGSENYYLNQIVKCLCRTFHQAVFLLGAVVSFVPGRRDTFCLARCPLWLQATRKKQKNDAWELLHNTVMTLEFLLHRVNWLLLRLLSFPWFFLEAELCGRLLWNVMPHEEAVTLLAWLPSPSPPPKSAPPHSLPILSSTRGWSYLGIHLSLFFLFTSTCERLTRIMSAKVGSPVLSEEIKKKKNIVNFITSQMLLTHLQKLGFRGRALYIINTRTEIGTIQKMEFEEEMYVIIVRRFGHQDKKKNC